MDKMFWGYRRTFIFYDKPLSLAGNIDRAVRLCVGNRICQNIRYGLFDHPLRKMYGERLSYVNRERNAFSFCDDLIRLYNSIERVRNQKISLFLLAGKFRP